jgi:uncharacterized protein YbjT (DUF2867 family)
MTRILILGAHGQIARAATELFLKMPNVELTLYLRQANRLKFLAGDISVRIVEGDVLDAKALEAAMVGQDVVYANLDGKLENQARLIVSTMDKLGVKRLIFVSSMGIYDEIPNETASPALIPYQKSVEIIEGSDLDYTVIRPAWLNNANEIDYGITRKGESFKNASKVVSRKSVADLVVKLSTTADSEIRQSLGVHKGS